MTRSTSAVAVCCSSASVTGGCSPAARVALLQLLEQPGVLDGDDGLVRERLQQRDLLLGERADLEAVQHQHTDRPAVPTQRDAEAGPESVLLLGFTRPRKLDLDRLGLVVDVDDPTLQQGPP